MSASRPASCGRQSIGQRRDNLFIRFDIFLVLGEVMDEGEVGHAFGGFGTPSQAIQVFQRAMVDLCPASPSACSPLCERARPST